MDLVCPACLGPLRPHTLVIEDRYRLLRCADCRSQCLRPDPALSGPDSNGPDSEYWEEYKFGLYGSPVIQAAFEARYGSVLATADAVTQPLASVLDAGCGVGNFVDYADRAGLRAVGTDVDAAAVEQARSRGLTAWTADQLDEQVPDASVDALSLWDVVEHLADPQAVLAGLVRKVRPGGVLLLETPDGGFPVRSVLLALQRGTRGRVNLCPPMYYYEHKVYFTERGLRRLLSRLGVELVSVRRETSLREKMSAEFEHNNDGTLLGRFLDAAWPALETVTRRAGMGNKLLVVARKQA